MHADHFQGNEGRSLQIQTSTILIASDIHIREANEDKVQCLLAALQQIDPAVTKTFVFLGDIFDFCFGDSPYFQNKFNAIGAAVSRLTTRGVEVLFLHGNHEFFLPKLGWEGVTWISSRDHVLTTSTGERVALTHGDFLLAPWHYRVYMGCVRSTLSRLIARQLPQEKFDAACLGLAAKSRKNGAYKEVPHRRLLEAATRWIAQKGCTVGIMGHYHLPYDYTKDGCRILCLPAWDTPNLLAYDGTHWGRISL